MQYSISKNYATEANAFQNKLSLSAGVKMRRKLVETVDDWWPRPWPGRGDDDGEVDQARDLNPVLLVPGIGGSILHAVSENGHKERIWVRLFAADHEFRAKLFSLYDPVTGKTNSLDSTSTIEVPDERFGLYSCDILDPAVVIISFLSSLPSISSTVLQPLTYALLLVRAPGQIFRMDDVYYFHDLIKQLTAWGYQEGTTLFGFGYDFRQSNRCFTRAGHILRLLLFTTSVFSWDYRLHAFGSPGYQNTWRSSKQSWRACTKHLGATKPTSLLIPWVGFL